MGQFVCCCFLFSFPFPLPFCRHVLLLNAVESSFFYNQLCAVPVIALPLVVLVLASLFPFSDNVSLWFCVSVVCAQLFIMGSSSMHSGLTRVHSAFLWGLGEGGSAGGPFLPQQ